MTGIIKTDQLQGAQSSTIAVPSGNNLTVGGTLGVTGVLTGTSLDISGNIDIDGTSNLDVVDIDGAVNMASTLIVSGTTTIQKASSGGTANSSAALVIEGTDATKAHIQLLCDNSDVQSIYFGDAADNDIGRIAYDHTGNTMRFNVNAAERMRIDSSGNVGINLSSPDRKLVIKDTGTTKVAQIIHIDDNNSNATGNPLHINYGALQLINSYSGASPNANGTKVAKLAMATVTTSGYGATGSITCLATSTGYNSGSLAFNTGSDNQNLETERMRIGNSGDIFFGCTAQPSGSTGGSAFMASNHGRRNLRLALTTTADNSLVVFDNPNGIVGAIRCSGTSTSYVTSSDYRLKENVTYDFDATSRLKQLKPSRFNFKSDKDTIIDGFLAHEVSTIVPEAVSGEKDAMTAEVLYVDGDEIPDGKKIGDVKEASQIDAQGIDQSKLVPLLTKTLQEALVRIDTLEAEVKALKG